MWNKLCISLAIGFGSLSQVCAATFPERPVKLVIPFAAGGSLDVVGRSLALELAKGLGVQVVVENRPGATGLIGMQAVASAPPDGHTILMTVNSMTQLPAMNKSMKLDIERDLAPITIPFSVPIIIFSNNSTPYRNLSEFVDFVKKNPRTPYATSGLSSPGHVAFAVLNDHLKTQMTHIPYKGGAESTAAVVAGVVPIAVAAPQPGVGWAREGRLKMLGVVSAKRASVIPDVPSLSEVGVAALDLKNWFGLFAPGKTPKPIVDRLLKEVTVALRSEAVIATAKSASIEIEAPISPDDFSALISKELKTWPEVFKRVKLD